MAKRRSGRPTGQREPSKGRLPTMKYDDDELDEPVAQTGPGRGTARGPATLRGMAERDGEDGYLNEEEEFGQDLEGATLEELQDLADDLGIDYEGMRRADLKQAIRDRL